MSYSADQLPTTKFSSSQNGIGPFINTNRTIRFDFERGKVDFATLAFYVDVYADNDACSFSTTAGAGALFDSVRLNCGGIDIDEVLEYPAVVAHLLTNEQDYSTDASRNGGSCIEYGRGVSLGNGAANSTVFKVPLILSFVNDGLKLRLDQFAGKTYIEFRLADNAVALDDATELGSYTIKRMWMVHSDFRDEDVFELQNGDVVNVRGLTVAIDTSTDNGNFILPVHFDNAVMLRVLFNTARSGYTAANKFKSDITNVSQAYIKLNGRPYPDMRLGLYDFPTESYEMSHLANKPTRSNHLMYGDFIPVNEFWNIDGTGKLGFITFPLYARKAPYQSDGFGLILGGTKIDGQDALVWTQTGATESIIIIIEHTRKLYFFNNRFTKRDSGF